MDCGRGGSLKSVAAICNFDEAWRSLSHFGIDYDFPVRGPRAPKQIALEFDPEAPAGGVMGWEMRFFFLLIPKHI